MTTADEIYQQRIQRARTISASGGLPSAISKGSIPIHIDVTVSEALVLGLINARCEEFSLPYWVMVLRRSGKSCAFTMKQD